MSISQKIRDSIEPLSGCIYEDSSSGGGEIVKGSGGAMYVADQAIHPGDDTALDRSWGGGKCLSTTVLTADALVKNGGGVLCGYVVHVATAGGVIEIRDSTTAGDGTVRITIPAATAVGEHVFSQAITCSSGIYLDFTGTGSVSVLYV